MAEISSPFQSFPARCHFSLSTVLPPRNLNGPSSTREASAEERAFRQHEQDPEGVDELEHTDAVGATASPSLDVLQSLAESVQLLSTEVKSLRQETNELRTLVRPPVSQQQQAQAAPLLLHCPSFVP